MKERKRDASLTVGAERLAAETETNNHESPDSTQNDTTSHGGGQMVHIADLLPDSAENGITLHHLEKMTDLDPRTIRARIEAERRSGELIVSDCRHGYWRTDDPAEADRFASSMEHRAREILKTAAAIRKAAGCD